MRKLVVALSVAFATTVIAPPAQARPTSHYVASLGSDRYYTAKSGHRVHSPVQANRPPAGASAKCGDGSYSFSENHRGTCSHHGGVVNWL